jgi:hypothetical protein
MAGLDALDADAQAQPPYGELAQAKQRMGAGERHAVVGADRQGQAELLEHPLEHGEGIDLLSGRQSLTAQEIAAGEVADGERVAVAPIGEHELALVVGAPQIVGVQRPGQGRALGLVASFAAAADRPWRSSTACTVLMAGVGRSLCRRLSFSRIFGAPQLGRSRLS